MKGFHALLESFSYAKSLIKNLGLLHTWLASGTTDVARVSLGELKSLPRQIALVWPTDRQGPTAGVGTASSHQEFDEPSIREYGSEITQSWLSVKTRSR